MRFDDDERRRVFRPAGVCWHLSFMAVALCQQFDVRRRRIHFRILFGFHAVFCLEPVVGSEII